MQAVWAGSMNSMGGQAAAGRLDVDHVTFCNVIEIMAGGCLTLPRG
jgi:hypothetical protein